MPYDELTRADLERFGGDDPHDPAYIYRSIFGSKMSGHRQVWPDIHLDELKRINPDCVGWVHMDASPINYPVVKQHFDQGYYLTHNFSGEESVHGQVVMGFIHGGRMGERTTVLHAHHMRDWSMFKAIVSLEDPDYLAAHPTVELVHEGTRYTARWFAGVNYQASDPWPERMRFADDAEFQAWLSRVMSENIVPADVQPQARADRLLRERACTVPPGRSDAFPQQIPLVPARGARPLVRVLPARGHRRQRHSPPTTPGAKMDVDKWYGPGEPFENPVGDFPQLQKDRLLACKTPDEIETFAKNEGASLDPRTYEALALYAGE